MPDSQSSIANSQVTGSIQMLPSHGSSGMGETTSPGNAVVNLLGVTYNTCNQGVHALLSGTVLGLARAHPNLTLRILDYGYEPAVWREPVDSGVKALELISLRFSWKLHLPNNVFRLLLTAWLFRLFPAWVRARLQARNDWLHKILAAEANLSLAGGDSFSDIYGLERFFYVCLPQLLVLCAGKPLWLLPQTYGPFNGWISRQVARFILKRAAGVYSRDVEGVTVVQQLLKGHPTEARFAPDVGFALTTEPAPARLAAQLDAARKHGPLVAFNISSLLYGGGYTQNNMFGLKADYASLVDALFKLLIRELGAVVLLAPHLSEGGKDIREVGEAGLYRRLLPKLSEEYPERVLLSDAALNHRQIKFMIGQCDFFIGSRMHACIAAISQCVPAVGLAYSGKFAGVLRSADPEICVVDLRVSETTPTLDAVRQAFARRTSCKQRLEQNMPKIRAALATLFEDLVPRAAVRVSAR